MQKLASQQSYDSSCRIALDDEDQLVSRTKQIKNK